MADRVPQQPAPQLTSSGEAFFTDGGFLGAMTMGRQKGFDLLEGGMSANESG